MVTTIKAAIMPRTAFAAAPPRGDTEAELAAPAEEELAGGDAVVVVGITLPLLTCAEVDSLGVIVGRAATEVEGVTAIGVSFVEVVLFGMGVLSLVRVNEDEDEEEEEGGNFWAECPATGLIS